MQEAKRRINNQFLITGFSISTRFVELTENLGTSPVLHLNIYCQLKEFCAKILILDRAVSRCLY
jgi:hypothetical protein